MNVSQGTQANFSQEIQNFPTDNKIHNPITRLCTITRKYVNQVIRDKG
jgi:hypothetical protein